MRKLLFFSIAMSLLLGTKAQKEIQKLESVPMQKPSIEKEMNVLFAPKEDVSVSNNYNYGTQKPRHKANYIALDTAVANGDFAKTGLTKKPSVSQYVYLFPDSVAFIYQYDKAGTYDFKAPNTWAATGFVFDPYSTDFDPFGEDDLGLTEMAGGVKRSFYEKTEYGKGKAYAYRLDNLMGLANYRLPAGYNPAVRDTLRFYITQFDAYTYTSTPTTYSLLQFTSMERNALVPLFNYPSYIPRKGVGGFTLRSPHITIDYILTEDDTLQRDDQYIYFQQIEISIPGGYEVEAGSCLGVMVEFIPGYDDYGIDTILSERNYTFARDTFFHAGSSFAVGGNDVIHFGNNTLVLTHDTCLVKGVDTLIFGTDTIYYDGNDPDTCYLRNNVFLLGYDTSYVYDDTLYARFFDTGKPENEQYLGDLVKKNTFAFRGYNYNATNGIEYLYDKSGFNTFLMETDAIRYRDENHPNDGNSVKRSSYAPGYYLKTAFWMSLSIDIDNYETIVKKTSVPDYKNLISKVYPNPANSKLTIDLNETGKANVTVYNILGQAIIEETLNDISNNINIADLPSGLYFVKVNQNGKSHTVKISKE